MASDAEVIKAIGNSWGIMYGSPVSSRQFYVSNIKPIRKILQKEQAAIRASGGVQRKITGTALIPLLSLNGPSATVPIEILIGASASTTGPSDGENAALYQPQSGYILIAIGGDGVSHISSPSDGGDAVCVGAGDSLIIALGGHAASPSNPTPMPLGATGTTGGDGGNATAVATTAGSVIHAYGGDGKRGSLGGNGRRSTWYRSFIRPGINGDDGDGGDALAYCGDHCDLLARGGGAPTPFRPRYSTPGASGQGGNATVVHGANDVHVLACTNGLPTGGNGTDITI
ncbi:hypothetical protein AAFN47_27430 [Hoeflea sp. CAU 1731]